MAASSKKRKAQILDEGSPIPIRKRKNTVRKQVNGSKSSLSPNTDDNNSHDAENGGSTLFDAQKEEILFQVKCPAASDIGKKRKSKADIFGPVSEDGGFSELQIKYTITPGSEWSNLRQYRNFIGKMETHRPFLYKGLTDTYRSWGAKVFDGRNGLH